MPKPASAVNVAIPKLHGDENPFELATAACLPKKLGRTVGILVQFKISTQNPNVPGSTHGADAIELNNSRASSCKSVLHARISALQASDCIHQVVHFMRGVVPQLSRFMQFDVGQLQRITSVWNCSAVILGNTPPVIPSEVKQPKPQSAPKDNFVVFAQSINLADEIPRAESEMLYGEFKGSQLQGYHCERSGP